MPQPEPEDTKPEHLAEAPKKRRRRSIDAQIAEVETELGYRKEVYPRHARPGSRKADEYQIRLETMEDVLATLVWCRDNRDLIAKVHAQLKEAQTQKGSPPAEAEGEPASDSGP